MNLKVFAVLAVIACTSFVQANAQTASKKQKVNSPKATVQNTKKTVGTVMPVNTVVLKNEKDSLSYALGSDIARSLQSTGFNVDVKILSEGLSQQLQNKTLLLTKDESERVIQSSVRKIMEQKNAELRKPGEEFLAKNKLKPSIKVTEEGVQYEVLVMGDGAQPTATDEVLVHYLGTLPSGEKFDSSYDRNQPLTLSLGSVIRGWQIGIPLMKAGSKFRFYIPYNLAYGERGSGKIPPFSPLIFEVELLEIKTKNEVQ